MNLLSIASRKLDELRGVPECEIKIREATNPDEPWGPSGTQMADLAELSENFEDRQIIIRALQSRFVPKEFTEWRQSYKSLLLVEYLVKNGSHHIIPQFSQLKKEIKMLTHFQYVESGKDHGLSVRERANKVLNLISDPEAVEYEREKAQAARGKYTGIENGVSKGSIYGSSRPQSATVSRSDLRSSSEPQVQRPNHSGYDSMPTPAPHSVSTKPTPQPQRPVPVVNKPPTRPAEHTHSHNPSHPIAASPPKPAATENQNPNPVVTSPPTSSLDTFFKEEIDIFSQLSDAQKSPAHDDFFGNFQSSTQAPLTNTSKPQFPPTATTPQSHSSSIPIQSTQFTSPIINAPPPHQSPLVNTTPTISQAPMPDHQHLFTAPTSGSPITQSSPVGSSFSIFPSGNTPVDNNLFDVFGPPVSSTKSSPLVPTTDEFGEFKTTPTTPLPAPSPKVDALSEMFAKQMEGLVGKPGNVPVAQRNVGPSLNQLKNNQQNILQF